MKLIILPIVNINDVLDCFLPFSFAKFNVGKNRSMYLSLLEYIDKSVNQLFGFSRLRKNC